MNTIYMSVNLNSKPMLLIQVQEAFSLPFHSSPVQKLFFRPYWYLVVPGGPNTKYQFPMNERMPSGRLLIYRQHQPCELRLHLDIRPTSGESVILYA